MISLHSKSVTLAAVTRTICRGTSVEVARPRGAEGVAVGEAVRWPGSGFVFLQESSQLAGG